MSQTPIQPETAANAEKVTPVRSIVGATISGAMATVFYHFQYR
jgi:hypothetical protein